MVELKKKKGVRAFIASFFLIILLLFASIASIDSAVQTFVESVKTFFAGIIEDIYNFFTGQPDWSELTLDELITVVEKDDGSIFTKEDYENMYIDKDTFLYLLKSVQQCNSLPTEYTYKVILNDVYTTYPLQEKGMTENEFQNQLNGMLMALAHQTSNPQAIGAILTQINQFTSMWYNGIQTTSSFLTEVKADATPHQTYQTEWKLVYLFATHIAVSKLFNGDEAIITRDDVDFVISMVETKFVYTDEEIIKPDFDTVMSQDYVQTLARYDWIEFDAKGHHVSGYIPLIGIKRVKLLYATYELDNDNRFDYSTDIMVRFYELVYDVCANFDFDIFIEQIQKLPGSSDIAGTLEYLEKLYEGG